MKKTRIMKENITYYLVRIVRLLAGYTPTPKQIEDTTDPIPMYPDYTDIIIPTNIAPLNFLLKNDAGVMQVTLKRKPKEVQLSFGKKAIFPLNLWESLSEQEVGNRLQITVVVHIKGKRLRYPSFYWQVVPEKLDSYVDYRLIGSGYEVRSRTQLCERGINSFKEQIIVDNKDIDGSCIDYHIYGNERGSLSMFHLRGKQGGALLNRNGHLRKLKPDDDSLPNGAIYGDFHPSGQFAVFSTNIIIPAFRSLGSKQPEVYDTTSDLVIVGFRKKQLIAPPLASRKDELETFPTPSLDGNQIHYCSAPVQPLSDSIHNLKYSLCRISFRKGTKGWDRQIEAVWDAQEHNGSAYHPKVSSDGKYLLFTAADYGTFPVWHRETDLHMTDLQTGKIDTLPVISSGKSDTCHSWPSNGHQFALTNKRGDGLYGEPYFSYVDSTGKAYKPFVLPQEDPEHYDITLKSYNIPELSTGELPFDVGDMQGIYYDEGAETFK